MAGLTLSFNPATTIDLTGIPAATVDHPSNEDIGTTTGGTETIGGAMTSASTATIDGPGAIGFLTSGPMIAGRPDGRPATTGAAKVRRSR